MLFTVSVQCDLRIIAVIHRLHGCHLLDEVIDILFPSAYAMVIARTCATGAKHALRAFRARFAPYARRRPSGNMKSLLERGRSRRWRCVSTPGTLPSANAERSLYPQRTPYETRYANVIPCYETRHANVRVTNPVLRNPSRERSRNFR